MIENLRILYSAYGGYRELLRSAYFRYAAILTAVSVFDVWERRWVGISASTLPTIAGFTIAAFALVFAVMPDHVKTTLTKATSTKHSAISRLSSTLLHAVMIQGAALLISVFFVIFDSSPYLEIAVNCKCMTGLSDVLFLFGSLASLLGLFLTYYSLVLIFASALTVFRLVVIISKAKKRPETANLDKPTSR